MTLRETGQFSGKLILTPILVNKFRKLYFQENFKKKNHNPVYLNGKPVQQVVSQIHFGMYLNTKLNFSGTPK